MEKKRYILLTVFLIILTAFITFSLKKSSLSTVYPPVHSLSRTDNLVCEEEIFSRIGAYDTCDGKHTRGFIKAGKQDQIETARIGQTEKWITKKAFDKVKINYRTENGIIYIKTAKLIEDNDKEDQYKIISEDDKYIIAQLSEKALTATRSSTIFLDKSKGMLVRNNISTYLFCRESVNSDSTLFSCREN